VFPLPAPHVHAARAASTLTHHPLAGSPPLLQSNITATDLNAAAVRVVAGNLADAQQRTGDAVGSSCDAGRYGVMVGGFKVCPLCASGTSGDGFGCTACDAGKSKAAVGAATCDACAEGSYAQGGEWLAQSSNSYTASSSWPSCRLLVAAPLTLCPSRLLPVPVQATLTACPAPPAPTAAPLVPLSALSGEIAAQDACAPPCIACIAPATSCQPYQHSA
jgi:hypothetical protein